MTFQKDEKTSSPYPPLTVCPRMTNGFSKQAFKDNSIVIGFEFVAGLASGRMSPAHAVRRLRHDRLRKTTLLMNSLAQDLVRKAGHRSNAKNSARI